MKKAGTVLWESLHLPLLLTIFSKQGMFLDVLAVMGVCSSWREATRYLTSLEILLDKLPLRYIDGWNETETCRLHKDALKSCECMSMAIRGILARSYGLERFVLVEKSGWPRKYYQNQGFYRILGPTLPASIFGDKLHTLNLELHDCEDGWKITCAATRCANLTKFTLSVWNCDDRCNSYDDQPVINNSITSCKMINGWMNTTRFAQFVSKCQALEELTFNVDAMDDLTLDSPKLRRLVCYAVLELTVNSSCLEVLELPEFIRKVTVSDGSHLKELSLAWDEVQLKFVRFEPVALSKLVFTADGKNWWKGPGVKGWLERFHKIKKLHLYTGSFSDPMYKLLGSCKDLVHLKLCSKALHFLVEANLEADETIAGNGICVVLTKLEVIKFDRYDADYKFNEKEAYSLFDVWSRCPSAPAFEFGDTNEKVRLEFINKLDELKHKNVTGQEHKATLKELYKAWW